jgi:hypothetical protein
MAVKRRFYKEKHRGRRAKSSVTSPLLRLPLSLSSNSSCSRAAAAAPFFNGRGGEGRGEAHQKLRHTQSVPTPTGDHTTSSSPPALPARFFFTSSLPGREAMAQARQPELFAELWRACAGPLVELPQTDERVFYFLQGHLEQVTHCLPPL